MSATSQPRSEGTSHCELVRSEQIHNVISALLKRGEIPDQISRLLMTEKNMPQFDRALTHKSYSKTNNYEFFEFIGDSIINLEVALYVYKHFALRSAGTATIIKHKVQSNKLLGQIAEKYGLVQLLLRVPKEDDNEIKIKGDVMESIMGCLCVLTSEIRMESTAKLLCAKIIRKLLEECNLDELIDPENCKDPVTTFKEEYPDHYRWPPVKRLFRTTKLADEMIHAELYGVIDGKFVKLADAESDDIKAAKKIAATRAMEVLRSRYGLFGKSRSNEDQSPERAKCDRSQRSFPRNDSLETSSKQDHTYGDERQASIPNGKVSRESVATDTFSHLSLIHISEPTRP